MSDPLGLIGATLDEKYRIEGVVGEGGYAVVYKATHLVFKRPVAIKAFRALSDYDAEARARLLEQFVQEGRVLAELSERSAAIVQARDFGTITTSAGTHVPYMVLEWLEGATLEEVIAAESQIHAPPRTVEAAIAFMEPIADALALAHRSGIAHRDIKPANVFVVGDARAGGATVKLLDFGIAKVLDEAQQRAGALQKTAGHVTSFTPGYGAPEQFSRANGATGPWTDVFAFALVLVELMSGRQALAGDTLVQVAFASADPTKRPTPRACGVDVNDDVEAVFAKALAVKPADRYPTAAAFWEALRAAASLAPRISIVPASRATLPPASRSAEAIASPLASTQLDVAPPSVDVARTGPTPDAQPRPTRRYVALGALGLVGFVAAAFAWLASPAKAPAPLAPSASASPPPVVSAPAPPKPACPSGMVLVPGGEFFMGSSDPHAKDNEKPAHPVTLNAFCIDVTEVTVDAYKACSDVGKCAPAGRENFFSGLDTSLKKVLDPLCNVRDATAKGKHPVNCVDWDQASAYCQKQGGRLPTEAEWEFAARGPDGRAYPWGDEAPSARFLNACGKECIAWGKKNRVDGLVTFAQMDNDDDGFATTAPVGSFPEGKSRYGLMDVVGNVWEWTGDFYAEYTKEAATDPKGPASGEDGRVARGGAWNGSDPSWVRPTFRFHFAPESRSYGVGFRCAATPSGATSP